MACCGEGGEHGGWEEEGVWAWVLRSLQAIIESASMTVNCNAEEVVGCHESSHNASHT